MQTSTTRGMQTMEQSLADLVLRRVITVETALARTSRPEQLAGVLERAGFQVALGSASTTARRRRCIVSDGNQGSIWKKEISFRRKPPKQETAAGSRPSRSRRDGRAAARRAAEPAAAPSQPRRCRRLPRACRRERRSGSAACAGPRRTSRRSSASSRTTCRRRRPPSTFRMPQTTAPSSGRICARSSPSRASCRWLPSRRPRIRRRQPAAFSCRRGSGAGRRPSAGAGLAAPAAVSEATPEPDSARARVRARPSARQDPVLEEGALDSPFQEG